MKGELPKRIDLNKLKFVISKDQQSLKIYQFIVRNHNSIGDLGLITLTKQLTL